MSMVYDGGPAFPVPVGTVYDSLAQSPEPGMSLRDYFAGQAMSGRMSQQSVKASTEHISAWAYRVADAMLRARDLPPEKLAETVSR
jgi:hypothetical protein